MVLLTEDFSEGHEAIYQIAMVRYSKRTPKTVTVREKQLVCPVCENNLFIETRAQLNTAAASFFDLDWANKEARCFVCSECSYIYWFRN